MEEKLERAESKELNNILGKKFPVLNDGHIMIIDYIGNDSSVVQAARVSCGKGTKKSLEDEELIRYLIRHEHLTPLEMCSIKLKVRVPMDCWRQWTRHRTSKISEISSRYSIIGSGCQTTKADEWRTQSTNNKQGSGGFLSAPEGVALSESEVSLQDYAINIYNHRLEKGVAREQARKDLPLSTYTEAYWKIDLRNLLHFLELRLHPHAQLEIRSYATIIAEEIVSKWVPVVWNAFKDYKLNAISFTGREKKILSDQIYERKIHRAIKYNWLPEDIFKNKKLYKSGKKKFKPHLEVIEMNNKVKDNNFICGLYEDFLDLLYCKKFDILFSCEHFDRICSKCNNTKRNFQSWGKKDLWINDEWDTCSKNGNKNVKDVLKDNVCENFDEIN